MDFNPSHIMGLMDLYRVTGETRYRKLADVFIAMRGSQPVPPLPQRNFQAVPGDQTQDRVPLRRESQAVGHAVTGGYLYCGAADLVAETGENALAEPLRRIWDDITQKKMYITGANGAIRKGVSIRNDPVHEAFGAAYDLPPRLGYNETCANIAGAMFGWRMLLLTGEARYADVTERVFYNSLLSAMSLDGQRFCYCNPLERRRGVPLESHDTEQRWITHTCYCCPPSVARTLARLHTYAYSWSNDGGLWVNLYGGNTLDQPLAEGGRWRITQTTDYPWEGSIRLEIAEAPAQSTGLNLRIPGWAERHYGSQRQPGASTRATWNLRSNRAQLAGRRHGGPEPATRGADGRSQSAGGSGQRSGCRSARSAGLLPGVSRLARRNQHRPHPAAARGHLDRQSARRFAGGGDDAGDPGLGADRCTALRGDISASDCGPLDAPEDPDDPVLRLEQPRAGGHVGLAARALSLLIHSPGTGRKAIAPPAYCRYDFCNCGSSYFLQNCLAHLAAATSRWYRLRLSRKRWAGRRLVCADKLQLPLPAVGIHGRRLNTNCRSWRRYSGGPASHRWPSLAVGLERQNMAKYPHRLFEMYEFRDEAARALTPRVERTITDISAPVSWAVTYLAVTRTAGITHIRFQGTKHFGDEILSDLREDFTKVAEVLDRDSKVVLDFTEVESFGAGAVNALALFNKSLKNKGSRIALCALAPSVRASFFVRQDKTGVQARPVPQAGPIDQNT